MAKILHSYPGNGYHYVICDICGFKVRAKETKLIQNKFHTLNGLLVCKKDYDEINPQAFLRAKRDTQIKNPRLIRSEGTDKFVFIDTAAQIEGGDTSDPSGRSPGAPKYLTILGGAAASVELQWLGPDDNGSFAISGYKIERESPVGNGFSTLVSNTGSVATYYKDTTASASTQYNYRVSAINKNGTGSASNEAAVTT